MQNRERMLHLAEIKSQANSSLWMNTRELESQLRKTSTRRGPKRSPIGKSRELIQIYFENNEDELM